MNHIYQIVFNRSQQCYQAVAETATSQGKTKASKLATSGHIAVKPNAAANLAKPTSLAKPILLKPIAFSVLLGFSAQLFSGIALAEPTGGQVTAGAGTINQAGTTTTINQATQNMAIDWHSFNVRANEAVNFNQPNANAIALNRITGTESSSIMGSLTANGKVFILNPNGVLFGNGAQVNVGGLVASTLSLSNANFMAGNFNFTGNGNSASIVNNANINIAQGGTLAFIAPVVKNNGTIIASQGSVILAAADDVTLTLQNGGLTSYTLNKGSVQTLIDNGGLIQADGGHVVLTAKGLDALSQSAINHTGIIEAQTVSSINGKIELLGDMQIGKLDVSGKLDASAPASKNPNGGDGGFVETSAAKVNIADSTFVTTKSDIGKTGTWLIDPTDFNINAGSGARTGSSIGATTLSNNLRNSNVEIATVGTGAGKGDIFVNSAVNWSSNLLTLSAHGDIQVNANLNGTGSAQLALESRNFQGYYYLNNGAKINLPSGVNLFLTQISIDGTVYDTDSFSVINSIGELDAIRLNLYNVVNNQESYVKYALGSDLDMSSVDNFVPIGGSALESVIMGGRFHGLGHKISNLNIHDANFDSIGLFASVSGEVKDLHLVDVNFRRNTSFTVGGIAGGNFGSIVNCSVTGNIEGSYQVAAGGLVGFNQGVISESYSNAEVISNLNGGAVGGLVGVNQSFINTSYATGAVGNAGYATGGLVGDNEETGNISNSYATGEVFGANNGGLAGNNAGGLAGNNDGSIENSYAIGRVTSTTSGGGLVDNYSEFGPATNSYWNTQTSNQATSAGGTGKTTAQMQQQSTYAGWDFDNVWRINEGSSYPMLRALTQGTITVDPTALGVIAPDVAKVYDGIGVNALYDLAALTGWDAGAFASGLIGTDSLTDTSIFSGSLTYDGTWLGARNAGEYSIIPTGLSSQKYDIQFIPGTLYIVPRVLDVAVTKTVDGNATFNTGYRIINNSAIAGEIINVTGSATVASANTGVYNSFVSNNLVTDNPNYTANPVDTDYYEYTGTGQVVATIVGVPTPTEPVKDGDAALSESLNSASTSVKTTTATLNGEARFITASLPAPNKTLVMSYTASADSLNSQYANASIGGNTAFSGSNSAFSGVGVKLKGDIGRSVANNIPDFNSYTKTQGVDFAFDKGIGLVISSGFATFFSEETSLKLAKFFGQETASRFTTASKTVADKFINELKKYPNPMELGDDFVRGLFVDAAKSGVKEKLGATGYGAGEYAVDAFAAIVDASLGSILDPKMNPIQAKIKFQVDLTIQLGILTTRQVIRTGSAFNQINKQEKANVISMADSIIQSASYLQAGKLTQAKQQIQTNPIAEGHGLKSQFTYGIDSKFAEALVLKNKGDMQGANQLIRQAMLEANSLDNSQGTHNGNSSFWDWSGTTSYSGYSSKMGGLLGFTVPIVSQGGFSGAGSTSNNGR